MSILRRLAGAGLLLAAYAPLHRLLDPDRTGPAGIATREAAETAWVLGLSGTLIALAFAWLLARMVPGSADGPDRLERWVRRLTAPAPYRFAVGVGAAVTLLAGAVARIVHGVAPTSVDEMAQLLHATALAGGSLTLPLEGAAEAWVIQNGVVTGGGWASIYPPMHTILLAMGLGLGAAWAVGPLLAGVATACFIRSAEDLSGPVPARLAGLLLAVSPFWLLLGGSMSNHVAAAAGLAIVLLAGLRARDGGLGWAFLCGAAVGFAVASRPWMGLVGSTTILGALWWEGRDARPLLPRLAAVGAGGAPFALLLLGWNQVLFGSPWRLGYTAAFGPAHGLGFHPDPWGNRYGPLEAVAYTASDLTQLGVRLLESPLPALALVGLVLLARPLGRGAGVFGAWAGAGVAAALLYWHHGIHFGPRMLYETVPAWTALLSLAAVGLMELPPSSAGDDEAGGAGGREAPRDPSDMETTATDPLRPPGSTTARSFARWTVLVTLVGGVALAPSRIRSVAAGTDPPRALETPEDRALVFLHGSWASRISGRLVAAGMRRDSVETALRRNDICAVDRYARWRGDADREGPPPPLDFQALPGTPDDLGMRLLSEGNAVRVDPRLAFGPACVREARSDRLGVLDLEPLAWRLPPLPSRDAWVARDLGPGGNLPLLQSVDRTPYLLVYRDEGGPVLLDYEEGMELVWGGAAGAGGPG